MARKVTPGRIEVSEEEKLHFGLQHIPMKSEFMVHLFLEEPSAETLSSTLLEQPPPLAFDRFQQQSLSRPRSLPLPFSEPVRG